MVHLYSKLWLKHSGESISSLHSSASWTMSFWKLHNHNSFDVFYYISSMNRCAFHFKELRSKSHMISGPTQKWHIKKPFFMLVEWWYSMESECWQSINYSWQDITMVWKQELLFAVLFLERWDLITEHCKRMWWNNVFDLKLFILKALRLSHATLENTSPGKVMNLLSNDVYRFDAMSMYCFSLLIAPLLVVTVGYFLWIEVQWAGMFGLLVVFIIVPIQSNFTRLLTIAWKSIL